MSIEQTIIDLMPEIAEWNRRNFPDSGALHKAMGIVEETGELFHAILKGLQGIRHTPDEIDAMMADALADIGVYAIACAADLGAAPDRIAARVANYVGDNECEWVGREGSPRIERAKDGAEDVLASACGVFQYAVSMSRSPERHKPVTAALAVNCIATVITYVTLFATEYLGRDYADILRETWSRVVAKRDWRADPMGAGDAK